MPGTKHQAFVKLVKLFPDLPAHLLTDIFSVSLPRYHRPALASSDTAMVFRHTHGKKEEEEAQARGYNADQVIAYLSGSGTPRFAVNWEPQLHWDRSRIIRWKVYLATTESEQNTSAELIIYCPSQKLARKYLTKLRATQRSLRICAHFLTPDQLPATITPRQARRRPGMAALTAFARRDRCPQNKQHLLTFEDLFPAMKAEIDAARAAGATSPATTMTCRWAHFPAPRPWRGRSTSWAPTPASTSARSTAPPSPTARPKAGSKAGSRPPPSMCCRCWRHGR